MSGTPNASGLLDRKPPYNVYVGSSGTDAGWRIVGTGEFGKSATDKTKDGHTDILWRQETLDETAVWFMNGTTWVTAGSIGYHPGVDWQVVAAGDFGSAPGGVVSKVRDGYTDIVWQNKNSGVIAIWLMEGMDIKGSICPEDSLNCRGSTPGWSIVAAGDFGSYDPVTGTVNPAPDLKPDLVAVNYSAGLGAIWYMDGCEIKGRVNLRNPYTGGFLLLNLDLDKRIVGAGDYVYDGGGKADLLLRQTIDGRNIAWQMNGNNYVSEYYIDPACFDTAWRMAGQDLGGASNWRLNPRGHLRANIAANGTAGTRIDLTFLDFPPTTKTYNISRSPKGLGQWTTLQTAWASTTYSDSTAATNTLYDYVVVGGNTSASASAGVQVQAIEDRGRLLLVVESQLASQLGNDLTSFMGDLAADGWTVVPKTDAPRHNDVWDSTDTSNVGRVWSWIHDQYDPNKTNCVILLGHVAIPYSGTIASDGHDGVHSGPWTADAYYGDVSGPSWTASADGRFIDDFIPSAVEMAVGRIDFAGLPSVGPVTELSLIRQYLSKDSFYRKNVTAFPDRGVYTTYLFKDQQQDTAKVNSVAFWGNYNSNLDIAEPFRDSRSFRAPTQVSPVVAYQWAFSDGGGQANGIYYSEVNLFLTSSDYAGYAEPPIAFWTLAGSWFSDFNLSDDFARSVIAKPNYGLVVLPTSNSSGEPAWRLDALAQGDTMGGAWLDTVNHYAPDRYRWLTLIGDPTLRLNRVTPPTSPSAVLNGNVVTVNWISTPGVGTYFVYRATSNLGPFERVAGPVAKAPVNNIAEVSSKHVYMVRAAQITLTGRGSYWNLSQGSTCTVQ
jgi:hypothetical protein